MSDPTHTSPAPPSPTSASTSTSSLSSSSLSTSPSTSSIDEEQDRMMEEDVLLVDNDDHVIGHASKRITHKMTNIHAGMLHRAFSVFIFNDKNELLLQQRSRVKITFPLRWTNTCCSHPLYVDSEREEKDALGVKRAAIRKLEHELGIPADALTPSDFKYLTKIHYLAESDGEWGEHEIDWILFVKKNVPLKLNYNEVEGVQWVTPTTLRRMFDDAHREKQENMQKGLPTTETITPWFELIAKKLLFGWWEKLDDIIRDGGLGEEQRKIIHRLSFKDLQQEFQTTQ